MKIAIVSRFLPEKDGIAIYSDNLTSNLNCNVVKIGTLNSDAKYKLNFTSLSFGNKLQKIIKDEKIDLIHFQYIAPWYGRLTLNFSLVKALQKLKIPKIVTLHEVQYNKHSIKERVLKKIERRIVKYSTAIITHTERQADFINNEYNISKANCIYMGISLKENIPKKGKNILFFGMMSEGKGVTDLIEAIKYLADFKLKIAGRPVTKEYKNLLLKKAGDIDLNLGWISEKEKDTLYRWANIVVLPYRWAPYQSAILHDAISYNLPVVVTKVGAVWEIVDKFGLGEICRPKKPKEIADAIKKVHSNYLKYGNCLEKYRNIANWKRIGAKHIIVYREFI